MDVKLVTPQHGLKKHACRLFLSGACALEAFPVERAIQKIVLHAGAVMEADCKSSLGFQKFGELLRIHYSRRDTHYTVVTHRQEILCQ